jgi:hypothetical protein
VKLLRHREPEVRCYAIGVLRRWGAREHVLEIAKLLKDDSDDVREVAVRALGELLAREAAPDLIDALNDAEDRVRLAAAVSLCQIGRSEGVPLLLVSAGTLYTIRGTDYPSGMVVAFDRGLTVINGVARAEVWRELAGKTFTQDCEGTPNDVMDKLARSAGMKLRVAKDFGTLRSHCSLASGSDLREALELILKGSGYEVILEPGEIRIVPRDKAIKVWTDWLKNERKK